MFKLLVILALLGSELIEPLAEVGINIWNAVNVDIMIKDPESGYGNEFIFQSLSAELDLWPWAKIIPYPWATLEPNPWATLDPHPWATLDPYVNLENTTGKF